MTNKVSERVLWHRGKPGADDPTIRAAHRLLARLEPAATPPLEAIRVVDEPNFNASQIGNSIFINPHGVNGFYTAAQHGDLMGLAMLLHHEHHRRVFNSNEASAFTATVRVLERHEAPTYLIEDARDRHREQCTARDCAVCERTNIMSHTHDCPGCAALRARTHKWRTTGRLTGQDVHDFQVEHTMTTSYAPPDPYGLQQQLRAASGVTNSEMFEARYKQDRFRALAAEYDKFAAVDVTERAAAARLGCDVSELRIACDGDPIPPPPDPYTLAIEKLRTGQ